MNWDAIGAIGELLSAVMVLATLLYLSVQVRLANRTARFETTREVMAQFNACNQLFATDATIRNVVLKTTDLTVEESEQLYSYVDMYCNAWGTVQMAHDQGLLEDSLFNGALNDVGVTLERWPTMRQPIERWYNNYPDFKDTEMFKELSKHL